MKFLLLFIICLGVVVFVFASREAARAHYSDEARRRRRLDDLRAAYAKLDD